jgi:repressor LexA
MSTEDRFSQIVNFVHSYTKENGFPPNVREIGTAIGLSSSSSMHKTIKQCLKHGYVEMHPKIARSIRVSDDGKKLISKI